MGLVNRVVAPGEARAEAERLSHDIAGFPQRCLRNDRRSALESVGLTESEAMARELQLGVDSLEDVVAGLERFRSGEGRHGRF